MPAQIVIGKDVIKLSEIFPTEHIVELVPEAEIHSLGRADIKEIVSLKPKTMHEMGLSTWHAAMMSGQFDVDPAMLAEHVDSGDPNLLKRVSHALGQKVVFDLNYSYATIPGQHLEEPAIQSLIGHLYPNRLHIGDVKLLDPRKPRSDSMNEDDQSHQSLRLFGEFMENCRSAAEEIGANKITLTAAYGKLLDPFRAHGFEVEDSEMGRMAVSFGMGIPMEINI